MIENISTAAKIVPQLLRRKNELYTNNSTFNTYKDILLQPAKMDSKQKP